MKLLTTRPSSIFMRGPYVLKIRAMRISSTYKETESPKLAPRENFAQVQGKKKNIYQFHAAYDNQTLKSQQHAFPHHSSSEPL